jgi:alkanesulfonate monooxygenase SsuD/methylene tetrahydromethanopterin reductase-like flavin-dependent oxidoreductase (luciferase family)
MALKDKISFGMSLPHRSPDPIDMKAVRQVAQRAEALGFRDLWVTENTLNEESMCFDPVVVLTYAAAVTSTIRVGASVVVLAVHHPAMVAHQWATLDYVSDPRRRARARPSLPAVRGARGRSGRALPRGSRADPRVVE